MGNFYYFNVIKNDFKIVNNIIFFKYNIYVLLFSGFWIFIIFIYLYVYKSIFNSMIKIIFIRFLNISNCKDMVIEVINRIFYLFVI